jgi:hypothetical protein
MTGDQEPALPESCGVAFKEWAGVCQALADGRQSLILRKGGIAEGPRGFSPEHAFFWLFPTRVHEAEQGLRMPPRGGRPAPAAVDLVEIGTLVATGPIAFVDRLDRLSALEDYHVWNRETVEKRFHYRKPGLWVIGVRVFLRDRPAVLPVTPEFAGCKTWVTLDPPLPTAGSLPVVDEAEFALRMDRLRSTLDSYH